MPTFGPFDVILSGAHAYGNWWYTSSYEDFFCPNLLLDLTAPPTRPQYGAYWAAERDRVRNDVAFIYVSLVLLDKWFLSPVSQLPGQVVGGLVDLGGQVADLSQKALDAYREAANKMGAKVTVLTTKTINTAASAAEWTVDKLDHARWVIKNPGQAVADGALRLILNSDVTAHTQIFIPPTATSMAFGFEFLEASAGTALEVLIDNKLVYITRGEQALGKGAQVTDWLEIAPFAGRQVTLSFRLSNPVEGARGTVDVDDILIANVTTAGGPFAAANGPPLARQGSVITLDGTGSVDPDPGPNQLTFIWSQVQGSAVQLAGGQSARPSFVAAVPGAYSFALNVDDGQAASLPAFTTTLVPRLGDIDNDGDVDSDDLAKINAALNTKANGPNDLRDLDGDGRITGLDTRRLVTLCTRPRCATR